MIAVTPEKCTVKKPAVKMSFRMEGFLYEDFRQMMNELPGSKKSKLLNKAVSLLLLDHQGILVNTTDPRLFDPPLSTKWKRPTKRKLAAKKPAAKKRPKR